MVCSVADNAPLKALRDHLGQPRQCHSGRAFCIRGYSRVGGPYVFGIPGTALGYCQALFNRSSAPATHTTKVRKMLSEIGAPWASSHEMFWGYRLNETPADYLAGGMKPLLGEGRVPILISGLDPAKDLRGINKIMRSRPPIVPGEVVLVRVILGSDGSVVQAAKLILEAVKQCERNQSMPVWWPLLQGDLPVEAWKRLRALLGECWQFANVAVNPFTSQSVLDYLENQVTVGQIPLGSADGVYQNGRIEVNSEMRIMGAGTDAGYSLPKFMAMLSDLIVPPTIIVLGPSLPGWSDEFNKSRVAALLPWLRIGCDLLWRRLPPSRRETVWSLVA